MVELMARIRPFTAAPTTTCQTREPSSSQYDVISASQRAELLARSPYNVVHLTLLIEDQAQRDLDALARAGVRLEDASSLLVARQES